MGSGQVALVIIDDHPQWLHGLCQALSSLPIPVHVTYAGPSVCAAVEAATQMAPDSTTVVLAIVDAHRPDGSADLPAVTALTEAGIPVAIVTAQAPSSVVRALISAGAIACIPKADLIDSLDPLLQSVLAGERYPTPELTASLLPSDALDSLLPQQRQALHWHAAGIGIDAILQPCGIDREQFIAGIDALIVALPDHRTSANSSSDTAD